MKSLTIQIPDSIDTVLNNFVKAGYFKSEQELFLLALSDFIRRNQIDLMESFLMEDIQWAFKKKE